MSQGKSRISVVINTLNEETNLPYALRSVQRWVDEIIVVDMHSEDRTVEIARAFGAAVYLHKRLSFADPAREFTLAQATGDWILVLDADELIPPPLSRELRRIVQSDCADVVMIPRQEYMLGAPLRYTGWGPEQNKHPRFFKRDFMEPDSAIHHFLKPTPSARILSLPYHSGDAMVHFAHLDTAQFLDKLNRYTTIEASQSFERGHGAPPLWVLRDMTPYPRLRSFFRHRRNPWWAVLYAFMMFLSRYIKNCGYRDGWRGIYLSLFTGLYFLVNYAKLTELETVGTRETTEARYHDVAESILSEYETIAHDEMRQASLPPSCAR